MVGRDTRAVGLELATGTVAWGERESRNGLRELLTDRQAQRGKDEGLGRALGVDNFCAILFLLWPSLDLVRRRRGGKVASGDMCLVVVFRLRAGWLFLRVHHCETVRCSTLCMSPEEAEDLAQQQKKEKEEKKDVSQASGCAPGAGGQGRARVW